MPQTAPTADQTRTDAVQGPWQVAIDCDGEYINPDDEEDMAGLSEEQEVTISVVRGSAAPVGGHMPGLPAVGDVAAIVTAYVVDPDDASQGLEARLAQAQAMAAGLNATARPAGQTIDVDQLIDTAVITLAAARSDSERAEAVEELLSTWYAAWPDSAVTDPHAPLAGELVRLLSAPADAQATPTGSDGDDQGDELLPETCDECESTGRNCPLHDKPIDDEDEESAAVFAFCSLHSVLGCETCYQS